jgi:hypothetical protein
VKYRLSPIVFPSKDIDFDFSENNGKVLQNNKLFSPPITKPNFPIIPVTEPERMRWNGIK